MNYTLEKTYFIEQRNSTGYMYKHKSGANIIFMKNKDENRVFSISFKTPVHNNTGVAHVLEHIILTGSKKYPIKDPFNELSKGSLHTYLNAMTFRDKTMYPIASRNESEFKKLMDIYLDAVFNPLFRKEMFLQEGINYIFEDGAIKDFTGIVYNEMLGVYSDCLEIMQNATYETLFKTTNYNYDAGGNPKDITNLTYEDVKYFYKKYYKRSNCYIYLYGDLDIDYYLDYIDKEYLNTVEDLGNVKYEKEDFKIDNVFIETEYESDDLDEKKYLSASFIMGESIDDKLMASLDILSFYLFQNNSSPLKKQLLNDGYGKNILVHFDKEIINPVFSIISKHTNKEIHDFKDTIMNKLKKIVDDGIDKELMDSCLNKIEFLIREENYGRRSKGLSYNIAIMGNWLNDENPFEKLESLKRLEEIREHTDKKYFENIITKYFLENKYVVFNTLNPKSGVKEKENLIMSEKIKVLNNTFSKEKLCELQKEQEALEIFHNTPDSEEDMSKIKPINIKDIKNNVESIPTQIINFEKSKIIFHDLDTKGVFYLQLMFDTSKINIETLQYLDILESLLKNIDTKNRNSYDLLKQTNFYFGGLTFSFKIFENGENCTKEMLVIKIRGLYRNLKNIFDILEDIMYNTDFSNTDKIIKKIEANQSSIKKSIVSNGDAYGIRRAESYFNVNSKTYDDKNGIGFYIFLEELLKDENIKEKLTKNLTYLTDNIFVKNDVVFSLTCEQKQLKEITTYIEKLYSNLKELDTEKLVKSERTCNTNKNEVFKIDSNIMYNVVVTDLNKKNIKYEGAMSVLSNILEDNYLLENLRIKGGAYGYGSVINQNGTFAFYSYRDPNLYKTIETYKGISDYIKNLDITQDELDKYIIGTINKYDKPMSIFEKGASGTKRFLLGITDEEIKKIRDEILDTKINTIKSFAHIFENIDEESYFNILGNSDKIDDEINKINIKCQINEIKKL